MLVIFLLASFLATSCKKQRSDNVLREDVIVDTSISNLIRSNNSLENIFTVKSKIILETTENSLINSISKVLFLEEEKRIVILDKRGYNVLLFDIDGRFISRLGRRGEGEDEFNKLSSIAFKDRKIYITSFPKILVFNTEGKFLKYYNILKNAKPFYIHKMKIFDNYLIAYQNMPWEYKADIILYSLKDEKIIETFGTGLNNYTFSVELFTQVGENNFLFTSAFNDILFELNIKTHTINRFADLMPSQLPVNLLRYEDRIQQLKWIMNNREEMKNVFPYIELISLDGFVFLGKVQTGKGIIYEVYDVNGNYLNTLNAFSFANICNEKYIDVSYEINSTGLILNGFSKDSPLGVNPVLLICSFKK